MASSSDKPFDRLGPTKFNAIGCVRQSIGILFNDVRLFATFNLINFPFVLCMYLVGGAIQRHNDASVDAFIEKLRIFRAIAYCLGLPIYVLATAAIIRATSEILAGERPQLLTVIRQFGFRNMCGFFFFAWCCIVSVSGVELLIEAVESKDPGFKAFVAIVSVALLALWMLLFCCVMNPCRLRPPSLLERRVLGVVKRAWDLSSGHRAALFATYFLFQYVDLILMRKFRILNLFWLWIGLPLFPVLTTVLYIRLRVAKEGLTLSVLRQELGLLLMDDGDTVISDGAKLV